MKQQNSFEMFHYCNCCGKKLPRKLEKCPDCGFLRYANNPYPNISAIGSGGIGWSDKISDPRFAKYKGKARKNIIIWCTGLAALVPGALHIFGQIKFDSEGIIVTFVVGGMFLVIGLIAALNTLKHDKGWEGVVESKNIDRRKRKVKQKDGSTTTKLYNDYIVTVRLSNGITKEISHTDNSRNYEYLNIGDFIRNHQSRNLNYIEKYDKSHDEIIFCAACGYVNDIRGSFCQACGCPLIK